MSTTENRSSSTLPERSLDALCVLAAQSEDDAQIARLQWTLDGGPRRLTVLPHRVSDAVHLSLIKGGNTAWLQLVRDLEIYWTLLECPGLQQAADRGHLSRLRSLTLLPHQEHSAGPRADFFDQLTQVFQALPRLERLTLLEQPWLREHAAALGGALNHLSVWPWVAELQIDDLDLHTEALVALGQAMRWPSVRKLVLERVSLSERGSVGVLATPGLAVLGALRVERGQLSAAALDSPQDSSRPALDTLELQHVRWADGGLADWAESDALRGLRRLVLESVEATDEELRAVARLAHRAPLTEVSLRGNALYDAQAVAALIEGSARTLVALDLSQNSFDDALVTEVLARSEAPALRVLDLRDNKLTDQSAEALATAPLTARLEQLRLSGNSLSDAGLERLLASTLVSEALKVTLWSEARGVALEGVFEPEPRAELASLSILADAPAAVWGRAAEVRRLHVTGTEADFEALQVLPRFEQLQALSLESLPIPAERAQRLMAWLPEPCHDLTLRHAQADDATLARLLGHMAQLPTLDLAHNRIQLTDEATYPVALLESLSLRDNHLEQAALDAVWSYAPLSPLHRLDLASNRVRWRWDAVFPMLERLDLSDTDTVPSDLLAHEDNAPRLRWLDVSGCASDAQALCAFLEHHSSAALEHLGLARMGLNDTSLSTIAKCTWPARLSSLNLSANTLGDDGIAALLAGDAAQTLTRLDLAHNAITDATLERLARTPRVVPWASIRLEGNAVTPEAILELMHSAQVTDACRTVLEAQLALIA